MKTRMHLVIFLLFILSSWSPAEWQLTNHGECSPITIATNSSGSKILVGIAKSGYWLTENGGQNWIQINERIVGSAELMQIRGQFNAIAVDPNADTLMVNVMANHPLGTTLQYHTVDGGLTFSSLEDISPLPDSLPNMFAFSYPSTLLRHRTDRAYLLLPLFFCRLEEDIWHTTSLEQVSYGVQNMLVNQDQPDTIFATGWYGQDGADYYGGVIASYDAGDTWTRLTHMEELTQGDGFILDLVQVNPDTLIAMTGWYGLISEHPPLLWTTDSGQTWSWIESTGLPTWAAPSDIEFCPERQGRLILTSGTATGVWKSDDWGLTWHRLLHGLPEDPSAGGFIYRNPYSHHLYVLFNGHGIYKSEDHGDSWFQIPTSFVGVFTYPDNGIISDEAGVFQLSLANDVFFSQDNPDLFTNIPRPVSATDVTWLYPRRFTHEKMEILGLRIPFTMTEPVSYLSMWVSYDEGESWVIGEETEWELDRAPVQTTVVSDSIYLASNGPFDYLISFDAGATWAERSTPFQAVELQSYNSDLYARSSQPLAIMRSQDYGESWESLEFPFSHLLEYTESRLLFVDDSLYVCASSQPWVCDLTSTGAWQGREAFADNYYTFPSLEWEIVPGSDDTLFVCGDQGIHHLFISDDLGSSWIEQPIEMSSDVHGEACWQIRYDKWRDRLWIEAGYGMAYMDNPTLSVGEEVWTFIPANYVTLDAYPNPFNISSTIRYSLQRPAEIKLEVFDILGRQVATLAEGLVAPGEHRATFDASQLASGVYFVQLDTGGDCIRRKIVLTK